MQNESDYGSQFCNRGRIQENIVQKLKGTKFRLMIDEITDIPIEKYLCLVVHYFDDNKKLIVDGFYGLIRVTDCTAAGLYNSIKIILSDLHQSVSILFFNVTLCPKMLMLRGPNSHARNSNKLKFCIYTKTFMHS